jgi:hypothetical protein
MWFRAIDKNHMRRLASLRKMSESSSDSESSTSDDSLSLNGNESSEEYTKEDLEQLFQAAKAAMIRKGKQKATNEDLESEEVLKVSDLSSKYAQ